MRVMLSLFLLFSVAWIYCAEVELISQGEATQIALRNAKQLWGDVEMDDPIPCYDRDDNLIMWQFNFSVNQPFPDRDELLQLCSREQLGLWGSDWNKERFRQMEIGARTDKPVIWGYSEGLSYDYAYRSQMERIAADKIGGKFTIVKMIYINYGSRWWVISDGQQEYYVKAYPPPKVLTHEEFLQETAELVENPSRFDNAPLWEQYREGTVLNRAWTFIPNYEMMPFYQWVYGCSPCSAAMLGAYWDYNGVNRDNYSNLVDYHWAMWDDIQGHYDWHVPNLVAEFADAMGTDDDGNTPQGNIDDGIEEVIEDNGYDCWVYNNYIWWEYLWDYGDMFDEIANEVNQGYPSHVSIPGHSIVAMGYNPVTYDVAIHDPNYDTIQYRFISDFERVCQVHPHDPYGVYLTLEKPYGGTGWHCNTNPEIWPAGDVFKIEWNTQVVSGIYAKIWYNTEAGTGHVTDDWHLITANTPNDGAYNWHIPSGINSTECRIRVEAYNSEGTMIASDGSQGDFTINSGGSITDLGSGTSQLTDRYSDFFTFTQPESYWAVIAARKGTDLPQCGVRLYDSDDFESPLKTSNYATPVNLIAIDRNHLPYNEFGAEVFCSSGTDASRVEYEGEDDVLTVGTSPTMSWSSGQVARMWDVTLSPGVYTIKLDIFSGTADLGFALYSSQNGGYYRAMGEAISVGNSNGNGGDEEITVTISQLDNYGLCVWSNRYASASYRIVFGYPGNWTGTVSTAWNNPSNWGNGIVPNQTNEVVIPAGTPNSPVISGGILARTRSLTIEDGATLTVANGTIEINGTAHIHGNMTLTDNAATTNFNGHVRVYETGHLTDTASTTVSVAGSYTVYDGGIANLNDSDFQFVGSESVLLSIQSEYVYFKNLYIDKTSNEEVVFSSDSEAELMIKGDFEVAYGAQFRVLNEHPIEIDGNIVSHGGFRFDMGEIHCVNSGTRTMNVQASDILCGLIIHNNATLSLGSDASIFYLSIDGGTLDANGHTIDLQGGWANNAGTFIGTGSTVKLIGSGNDQYIDEDGFGTLHLHKSEGGSIKIGPSSSVTCDSFLYTAGTIDVYGGSFTANDLADTRVEGSWILNGGIIDLHQGTSPSEYVDLDASIWLYDGNFNIYGGYDYPSEWAYTNGITVYIEGGVLDFKDNGILISASSHYLGENMTGGVIRTSGDFKVEREGFQLSGGEVELYGSGTAYCHTTDNSWFNHLRINKASTTRQNGLRDDRIDRIILDQDTNIQGNLYVQDGLLELNHATVNLDDNLVVTSGIYMDDEDDILNVGKTVQWYSTSGCTILDGAFHVERNWYFNAGTSAQIASECEVWFEGDEDAILGLYEPTAQIGTVVMHKDNASCTMGETFSSYLNATGDLIVNDNSTFYTRDATIDVAGEIDTKYGGFFVVEEDADVTTQDLTTSGLQEVFGNLTVHGSFLENEHGYLTIYDGAFIIDTPYTGTYETFNGTTNYYGGVFEITNNGMQFGSSATFESNELSVRLGWGIRAVYPNTFQMELGTFELIGSRSCAINLDPTNYFQNLTCSKDIATATVYLSNDTLVKGFLEVTGGKLSCNHNALTVKQNLTIDNTGVLDASNADDEIFVGHNWYENRGPAGFVQGSGKVTFNSMYTGSIIGEEVFHDVEIDKDPIPNIHMRIEHLTDLTVEGTLTITNGNLKQFAYTNVEIAGDFTLPSSAEFIMYEAVEDQTTHFLGDVILSSGSTMSTDCGSIEIDGDFSIYGDLTVNDGSLLLHGGLTTASTGSVTISTGCFVMDTPYIGNWILWSGEISMGDGLLELTDQKLQFSSQAVENIRAGTIRVSRGFYAMESSVFQPSGGTLEFIGEGDVNIVCANGNMIYDLLINKTSGNVTILVDLDLSGGVTINGGCLKPVSNDILVTSHWNNNVGEMGFDPGSGTVVFQGSETSLIGGDATFHNVIVDKDLEDDISVTIDNDVAVTIESDLSLYSGKLDMKSNSTLSVGNDIAISNGSCLDIVDSYGAPTLELAGDLTDLNSTVDDMHGFWANGPSRLSFVGNFDQIMDSQNDIQLDDLELHSSSYFYPNNNLIVHGNLAMYDTSSWDYGSTGLDHVFYGDFTMDTDCCWFDDTGSITFAGTDDASFEMSAVGNCDFNDILINKSISRRNRVDGPTVILGSDLDISRSATLSIVEGVLSLNHLTLSTEGNIEIQDNARLLADQSSEIVLRDGASVDVMNGGEIVFDGYDSGERPAIGTSDGGYYSFDINSGGKISAEYAIFEHMDTDGINIHNGALIDETCSFNHCWFQEGEPGGTLVTIDNNQIIVCDGAQFADNTWGSLYNVTKNTDMGSITFTNESGSFTSSTYDNDPYYRIHWTGDAPEISVSPSSIDFGNVQLGDSQLRWMIIENNGNAHLSVNIQAPECFYVYPSVERDGMQSAGRRARNQHPMGRSTVEQTIAPGDSQFYNVIFIPTEAMNYDCNIVIQHNAEGGEVDIPCTASSTGPRIVTDPESIQVELLPGGSDSRSITISNTGNQTLNYTATVEMWGRQRDNLIDESFEGDFPPEGWSTEELDTADGTTWDQDWTVSHTGSRCARAVYWDINDARLITPQFLLSSDSELSFWIRSYDPPLYGGDFGVEISVDGGAWSFIDSFSQNDLTQSWQQLTYPLMAYEGHNVQFAFRVYNNLWANGVMIDDVLLTGTPVTIQWLILDGGTEVTGSIAAGGAPDVYTIGFDSSTLIAGYYMGGIQIDCNDGIEPLRSVMCDMIIGSPILSISDSWLGFGQIEVGETETQQFTIENQGDITLTGTMTTPTHYSVSEAGNSRQLTSRLQRDRNQISFSISPWNTGTFEVAFQPTEPGDFNEEPLVISHNAGSDESIDLYGWAIDDPQITSDSVIDLHAGYATGVGTIVSNGNQDVIRAGFCWNRVGNPTIDDSYATVSDSIGTFQVQMNALFGGWNYYCRAFVEVPSSMFYGDELTFTTMVPQMTLDNIPLSNFGETAIGEESIEQSFVVSGEYLMGDIILDAPPGFNISLTSEESRRTRVDGLSTSSPHREFTDYLSLTPIDEQVPETIIYVRFEPTELVTYEDNIVCCGINLDNQYVEVSGTGVDYPLVDTAEVNGITSTSAISGGIILQDNNSTVTAAGVCWSTSSMPTIMNDHTSENISLGSFVSELTNLNPDDTYYVRAYATNGAGTSYGTQVTFDTAPGPSFTISVTSLPDYGNIVVGEQSSSQTLTVSGTNLADPIHVSMPYGFVVSTSDTRSRDRSFSEELDLEPVNGIVAETTLYVRFAPGRGGDFDDDAILSTAQIDSQFVNLTGNGIAVPDVATSSVSAILPTSAMGGGEIVFDGWCNIIDCGICWSESPAPTLADNYTNEGAQTGSYASQMNGLTPGTTYFVRAWAQNEAGIAYGVAVQFTTDILGLDPPQNIALTLEGSDVVLSWDAITGANSYNVYRSETPDAGWILVDSTNQLTWTDSGAAMTGTFFYRVTADTAEITITR